MRLKTTMAVVGLLIAALSSCWSNAPLGPVSAEGTSAGASGAGENNNGDAGAPESSAGQSHETPLISGPPAPGGAFVQLFEWKWSDVAAECENYLGTAGFTAALVSPPSEHTVIAGFPWWQRYQTVSYSIAASRSGSEAEFKDMVQRCARVGVGIYVDAVFNHMTGRASGTGSNGTKFTKYEYPGLFTAANFHQPPCSINGADYTSAPDRVRTCELSGLADLRTEDASVREKIAAYLTSLTDLGVAGFRVDAGKHMYPADLEAIISRVNEHTGAAHAPFFFLEVIDPGNEAIHTKDYTAVGQASGQVVSITDFQYASLFDRFLNRNGSKLGDFRTLAASKPALASAQALVFTTNHDTERASPTPAISYKDGNFYDLATVFLLTWPYGYPSLMSSFAFDQFDQGPPSDTAGHTSSIYGPGNAPPNCARDPASALPGTWVCQHRNSFVAPLLAFRKATLGAEAITNFWDNGGNQLAFGRGAKGFVVINREAAALTRRFATSLPAGNYCDVYAGRLKGRACTGATITVAASGLANITVAPLSAVVIHVGQTQ